MGRHGGRPSLNTRSVSVSDSSQPSSLDAKPRASPTGAFSDATVLNCATFLVSFFQGIAFSAFQEKCLAWPWKNNIVHALPRLAEEDLSARAAFLSPNNSGGTLIFF
jgi:hypothetical protein